MNIKKYRLKLTLRSPFLIPSTQISAWGHDVSQMCDERGFAMIPGDLIKGLLRHAMGRLEQHCNEWGLVLNLFGQEVSSDSDEPVPLRRGGVVISDLVAVEKPDIETAECALYTRVHFNREQGAAEVGHLQVAEQRYSPGREVLFTGTLLLLHEPQRYEAWLKRALALIPAVGANKSCGYGELCSSELIALEPATSSNIKIGGEQLYVRLTFDRPLLVDSQRVAANLFRSSEVIPGSVIKGALAASLSGQEAEGLNEALSKIRFGFAHPRYSSDSEKEEPLNYPPLPLSLMVHPFDETGEKLFDAASYPYEDEVKALLIDGEIPVQLGKAKQAIQDAALERLGRKHSSLPGEVRVRTAINKNHNTAEGGLLFSYDMIKPRQGDSFVEWYARIDRNGADPTAFIKLLEKLVNGGLPRVGKTEAKGEVTLVTGSETETLKPQLSPQQDKPCCYWVVQLATPALMIDPEAQTTHGGLLEQYQNYWFEVAPALKLRQIFTNERLIGGFSAYSYRFREQDDYHPYLLTESGSVFVFEPPNDSVNWQCWLEQGLPLPAWVVHRSFNRETKRIECPFVPENGYGEVLIDPAAALPLTAPQQLEVSHVQ